MLGFMWMIAMSPRGRLLPYLGRVDFWRVKRGVRQQFESLLDILEEKLSLYSSAPERCNLEC